MIEGQVVVQGPAARAFSYMTDDPERPRIGVSTRSTSSRRDTLGLLVESVTPGGPAGKAGIEEGDRLVSVNSVNLRLSPADAGEPDMAGVATRRLIRELAKHKPGDEVELRVYRDGQTRTLRVRTVDVEDLTPEATTIQSLRRTASDRAALGISMGGTGSRRDTLGILVVGVTDSGPAALAGIEEGDRLAMINGVDLRVAREDAGDWEASNARIRRLNREMEKVGVGDAVELRVHASGTTRTVRVTTVKASDLHPEGMFYFGDLMRPALERIRAMPVPGAMIRPRIYYDSPMRLRLEPKVQVETQKRAAATIVRSASAPAVISRVAPAVISRGTVLSTVENRVSAAVAAGRFAPAMGFASAGAGTLSFPGLRLTRIGTDLADYLGAGSEGGLLVLEAQPGWRNIRAGDVILAIDGRSVRGRAAYVPSDLGDGQHRTVELMRSGLRRSVRVYREY
jgi:S1-C subfamily serine protease